MKFTLIILGLLIFLSSPIAHSAGGIGRVGTSSIGSETLGFLTPLPVKFPHTQPLATRLKITSPFIRNSNGQEHILVESVHSVFGDDTLTYDRKDWELLAARSSDSIHYVHGEDDCVLGMRWVNRDGQIFGLAVWGGGKGILFSSIGESPSWKAIRDMIQDIQLTDGACAWN